MAKFKKALALILSLAMVLTLAPLTSIQTKAAKTYSLTSKKTIDAGSYATLTLKSKKGQYVRIKATNGTTVKIGSKKIKSTTWYKTTSTKTKIKVIDNGSDKKYTSTVAVKIYKAKKATTKNLVKTLKSKVVVKAPVEVELALDSVEAGASTTSAAGAVSFNILIAYFNKAIDNLDPSEVQIRRVSDDQLFAVEKVVLSSNKKSATLTLANSSSAGANVVGLDSNVDYKMIVNKDGKTASKEFSIPATASDKTVSAIDPVKKTITLENGNIAGTGADGTYSVPDELKVDYEYLLGRTVTVKYDKTGKIVSLNEDTAGKVLYGIFYGDKNDTENFLVDAATKTKYFEEPGSATVFAAQEITRQNGGTYGAMAPIGLAGNEAARYAKLVLNASGRIRVFVDIAPVTAISTIQFEKATGTTIYDGTSEASLKDFSIIKDGKTIKVEDLAAGDVVFYSSALKFADVYTDKKEGTLKSVFADSFIFDSTTYGIAGIKYIDGSEKTADSAYFSKLLAGGASITLWFNRAGSPVYVKGTTGAVETTSTTLILTKAAETYVQSLENYIRVTGYDTNAKAVKVYDIAVSTLESVTNENGVSFVKGTTKIDGTTAITGFKAYTGAATANFANPGNPAADYLAATNGSVTRIIGGATVVTANGVKTEIDEIDVAEKIGLTMNKAGAVIGIDYSDGAAPTAFDGGAVATTAFKAGYKTVATGGGTYQLTSGVNVYLVDTAKNAVTASTYGEFVSTVSAGSYAGNTKIYKSGSNATDIVLNATAIGSANITGDTENGTPFRAVVYEFHKNAAGNANAYLKVLTASGDKEYTSFNSSVPVQSLSVGDVVTITPKKDDSAVNGISKDAAAQSGVSYLQTSSTGSFQAGAIAYQMSGNPTPIFGKLTTTAGVTTLSTATFAEFEGTKNTVNVWVTGGNTCDVLIMTATNAATKAAADANTAIAAANTAYTAMDVAGATPALYAAWTDARDAANNIIDAWKIASGSTTVSDALLGSGDTRYVTFAGYLGTDADKGTKVEKIELVDAADTDLAKASANVNGSTASYSMKTEVEIKVTVSNGTTSVIAADATGVSWARTTQGTNITDFAITSAGEVSWTGAPTATGTDPVFTVTYEAKTATFTLHTLAA